VRRFPPPLAWVVYAWAAACVLFVLLVALLLNG
jgi:hypothetical protein